MVGLRAELGQFSLLSRHFFGRLFRNETVDFEDQMKEKLYVALTLLAVFFAWASWLLLFKYHFVADVNRSWQEKNYVFTLMMLVFALIAVLVFLLLSFIAAPSILGRSFHDMDGLKETGDPFLFRFPPLWFVGLYEVILGTRDAVFAAQARTACLALVLALVGFTAASVLSYNRHVRKTLEVRKARPALFRLREGWRRLLAATLLRAPEERAVYGFFSDTLKSSPKHRTSLAYYLAVGAAVILLVAVAYRDAFRMLTPMNGFLLAQPLLLVFTLVAGVRVLVDQPAAPEANWVFRLTETPRTAKYLAGLKKAVFLKLILPLFIGVFGLHLLLWDAGTAFVHSAFGLVISGLTVEAAFYHYRKVPFACTYVPGKMKLHFTAIPSLIVLLLTMMALTSIEKGILRNPRMGVVFLAFAAALWLALREGNRRFYRGTSLVYEDEPAAAMIELPGGG